MKLRFKFAGAAILSIIVVPLFRKFQFLAKTGTIKSKNGRDYKTQKTGPVTVTKCIAGFRVPVPSPAAARRRLSVALLTLALRLPGYTKPESLSDWHWHAGST